MDSGDDARTMHDNTSRQRPESVQNSAETAVQTTVPIAEAAARLGISADAVRKRIQRGKLIGHKTDEGWTVDWIETDSRPETVQNVAADSSVESARAQERIAGLEALLTKAEKDAEDWKRAFERESRLREDETRELRQLVQQEQSLAIERLAAI